ncbi:hypothetical protein NVP1199A_11 [Vibrio phage 1.199.A._10N.286.55.C10]|nr:hypothetical protein NVP1199A_11 [Vibrio phage 1.199.A._10N.286.55.C10]AUR94954.1 hypothetical protein NVP1199B_11 [Vibrio phage 1.199.B._10N.286.55.C10]
MIYVVRARGIYWKDISLISTDKGEAIEKCKFLAKNDVDDYHYWCVTEHECGEISEPKSKGTLGEYDNTSAVIFETDKESEL